MNDDMIRLINDKGPEVAKQLQIATEQVYAKILWYIQISGIIEASLWAISLILGLIWIVILIRYAKKKSNRMDSDTFAGMLLVGVVGFAVIGLLVAVLSAVGMGVAKIFVPEYYLIHQVVEGLKPR